MTSIQALSIFGALVAMYQVAEASTGSCEYQVHAEWDVGLERWVYTYNGGCPVTQCDDLSLCTRQTTNEQGVTYAYCGCGPTTPAGLCSVGWSGLEEGGAGGMVTCIDHDCLPTGDCDLHVGGEGQVTCPCDN